MQLEENRKTVGACAVDLLVNSPGKQEVGETTQEMTKGYIEELIKTAKKGEELYGKEKHFYLCVQTRRERLLTNVIRNQFYPRQTRPTPHYDLALYFYEPKDEKITFIWCIPDRDTVLEMMDETFIPRPEERQLYGFVKSFINGTLI